MKYKKVKQIEKKIKSGRYGLRETVYKRIRNGTTPIKVLPPVVVSALDNDEDK